MPLSTHKSVFRAVSNIIGYSSNSGLSYSLNTSAKKFSYFFVAPMSMTMSKFDFNILSVVGTPVQYNVRIETDDGTGTPSGTLAWTNATATVTPTAGGWTGDLTLVAAGSITIGTIYHVVVQAAADPTSNYINIRNSGQAVSDSSGSNQSKLNSLSRRFDGTSWGSYNSGQFVCTSNDATPKRFGIVNTGGGTDYVSNTGWKGAKITAIETFKIEAVSVSILNSTSAGTCSCHVIDSTNTILATATLPPAYYDVSTGRGDAKIFAFETLPTLTKGQVYRVVFQDTSGAVRIESAYCDSGYEDLMPGSGEFVFTSGTSSDGSASPTTWTDTVEKETGLIIEAELVAAAGGSNSVGKLIGKGGGLIG